MDIERIGKELAKSGKLDRIKDMAGSEDAKRLSAKLDAREVEKAARSGDTEALKALLNKVLGTDEGKRLAQKINEAMK